MLQKATAETPSIFAKEPSKLHESEPCDARTQFRIAYIKIPSEAAFEDQERAGIFSSEDQLCHSDWAED